MTENNHSLTCSIEEIDNIVDDFVESIYDHAVKIDTSFFREQRLYNAFKNLIKLNLFNIIKETYKLRESQIKVFNGVVEKLYLTISMEDKCNLHYISKKFSEEDIDYIERVVKVYEEDNKQHKLETKQEFDQFEKEYLNKDKVSLIKSIKSLFIKTLKELISKIKVGKNLIECENPKKHRDGFIGYLPQNIDDLTDFGFKKSRGI